MKKFTDIGQFKDVIRAIKSHWDYKGKDENEDAIYSHDAPYPVMRFRGTTKLHGCVDQDTLITIVNGEQVKIKDILVDTYVLGFNTESNSIEYNKVLNVLNGYSDKEWCELVFDDRTITCTKDHKIWTKNRGYVEAQNLLNTDEFEII